MLLFNFLAGKMTSAFISQHTLGMHKNFMRLQYKWLVEIEKKLHVNEIEIT